MTTGELIFVGVVVVWIINMIFAAVNSCKYDGKPNWYAIIGLSSAPLIAIVAAICGLR